MAQWGLKNSKTKQLPKNGEEIKINGEKNRNHSIPKNKKINMKKALKGAFLRPQIDKRFPPQSKRT